jgi:hypothetical protein
MNAAKVAPGPWSRLLLLMACLPLLGIGSFQALFAPKKEPWPRWETNDPASTVVVDHSDWQALLDRYVRQDGDGINRVDYAAIGKSDRATLGGYIETLAATPARALNRDEQLAYWINLYNAVTVRTVIDAYPVASIRDIDISPGLFSDGPWGRKLVAVEGEALSLNDIEHRILRPLWNEPLIHYGVNCAALGCPNLGADAYTGAAVAQQLAAAARAYVNSPRGVWFDGESVGVSSIYAWFQDDFGNSDAGILAHLREYAEPKRRERLEGVQRIQEHAYDWGLNDATR